MNRYGFRMAAAAVATAAMMFAVPMVSFADEVQSEAVAVEVIPPLVLAEDEDGEIAEAVEEHAAGAMTEVTEETEEVFARQEVVDYALQFVGNPYRTGGNDPHTGADCSGFVKYVLEHSAGITMNRSSRSQATQGQQISAEEMRPGDLIFYGNGSSINHVAMYIGDGQIVHASTHKTGIKISNWNYRSPVKIVNMMG